MLKDCWASCSLWPSYLCQKRSTVGFHGHVIVFLKLSSNLSPTKRGFLRLILVDIWDIINICNINKYFNKDALNLIAHESWTRQLKNKPVSAFSLTSYVMVTQFLNRGEWGDLSHHLFLGNHRQNCSGDHTFLKSHPFYWPCGGARPI